MRNKKKKNAFCGGILCRKSDRKYKCEICRVWCCNLCKVTYKGYNYCIDCYIDKPMEKDFKESWNKVIDRLKVK